MKIKGKKRTKKTNGTTTSKDCNKAIYLIYVFGLIPLYFTIAFNILYYSIMFIKTFILNTKVMYIFRT